VTSPILNRAARLHARNMIRWGFFDHTDPLGRGPDARVAKFDLAGMFIGIGENIAKWYPSVHAACDGWLASEGHRENILDPEYTHIGSGYARTRRQRLYVQDFGVVAANPDPEPAPEPEPADPPEPEPIAPTSPLRPVSLGFW
jgi:uncharacterized protein YkwD